MNLRRTSTYLVLVSGAGEPSKTLDGMVTRANDHGVEINSSSVHPAGAAGVRFRCRSNDNEALNIALQIAGGRTFTLLTGYGVNQREVAQ